MPTKKISTFRGVESRNDTHFTRRFPRPGHPGGGRSISFPSSSSGADTRIFCFFLTGVPAPPSRPGLTSASFPAGVDLLVGFSFPLVPVGQERAVKAGALMEQGKEGCFLKRVKGKCMCRGVHSSFEGVCSAWHSLSLDRAS